MSQFHLVLTFIGNLEQGVGVRAVHGVHAGTETRSGSQQPALDLHGYCYCLRNRVGDLDEPASITDPRQDDDKLVTPDSCDGIGTADTGGDLARDVLQHDIASGMSERVVDLFEGIEVEIYDRQRGGRACAVNESCEALVQRGPVQKVRERIVLRPERELLVEAAPLDRAAREPAPRFQQLLLRLGVGAFIRKQKNNQTYAARASHDGYRAIQAGRILSNQRD